MATRAGARAERPAARAPAPGLARRRPVAVASVVSTLRGGGGGGGVTDAGGRARGPAPAPGVDIGAGAEQDRNAIVQAALYGQVQGWEFDVRRAHVGTRRDEDLDDPGVAALERRVQGRGGASGRLVEDPGDLAAALRIVRRRLGPSVHRVEARPRHEQRLDGLGLLLADRNVQSGPVAVTSQRVHVRSGGPDQIRCDGGAGDSFPAEGEEKVTEITSIVSFPLGPSPRTRLYRIRTWGFIASFNTKLFTTR